MRSNSAKTGLFTVEIAFCILFLSIVATICVKNVVNAYEISKNAELLNESVIRAQSTAELYKGLKGDINRLKVVLNAEQNGGELIIYYDEGWNTVRIDGNYNTSDKSFSLIIRPEPQNECKISIHKLPSNESIYAINIKSLGDS